MVVVFFLVEVLISEEEARSAFFYGISLFSTRFSSLSPLHHLTCDPGHGAADVPVELVHLLPPDADRVGVEELLLLLVRSLKEFFW